MRINYLHDHVPRRGRYIRDDKRVRLKPRNLQFIYSTKTMVPSNSASALIFWGINAFNVKSAFPFKL